MQVKAILLILMTLASVAMADDAKMKALLVGTWTVDDDKIYTFTPDGRWIVADSKFPNATPEESTQRWDIKDGVLIEIRGGAEASRPYPVLFLTNHECLLHWEHHGGGYALWTR